MNLNEKIKLLREKEKISQEILAEKLGISRQAVAKWEAGESLPDITNLIELSKIFTISLDKLLKNDTCSIDFLNTDSSINYLEIIESLVEAKKNTYAGDGEKKEVSSRPNSKDLEYTKGDYKYIDTYLGGEDFIGEEAVFYNDKPLWGMNYYGHEYNNYSGAFLKKALLTVSKEYPYRGIPVFKDGDYTYFCNTTGNFENFYGLETIYLGQEKVFECSFNGGLIK